MDFFPWKKDQDKIDWDSMAKENCWMSSFKDNDTYLGSFKLLLLESPPIIIIYKDL
jgi:hypothetical protein